MAQAVVSCPQCQKKYRVADDSAPGQFQCTQCGGAVAYGVAAARVKPAGGVARARPARPARGGRGAARAVPAGPARGGRGGARPARRGRFADRGGEEGPPPKSNAALYAVLGVAALLVVGIVVVIVVTSGNGDQPVTPVAGTGGGGGGNQGLPAPIPVPGVIPGGGGVNPTPVNPTPMNPAPGNPGPNTGIGGSSGPGGMQPSPGSGNTGGGADPEPAVPARPPAANAPSGGNYGKDRTTLKTMPESELIIDVPHLDDTASDLRAEIDRLCDLIVTNAGAESNRAQVRLAEIGRAALPRVLASFRRTSDWGGSGMMDACFIDTTLRMIVGSDAPRMRELKPMAQPKKDQIEKTVKEWYVWWFSKGYLIDKFALDSGGEEEE